MWMSSAADVFQKFSTLTEIPFYITMASFTWTKGQVADT